MSPYSRSVSRFRVPACVALALGLAGASFAANTTYYWTGPTGGSFHDKANWAYASGVAATATPYSKDTVVFTNATALAIETGSKIYVDAYRFEGVGDVSLGQGNAFNLRNATGGGGIFATGSGTYDFNYTVDAPAALGDYPVEVAAEATVNLCSYGTATVNDGAVVVKRGPGHLTVGYRLKWLGGFRIEEGTLRACGRNEAITTGPHTTLSVDGTSAKELYCEGGAIESLNIARYSESSEAASTLTIRGGRSAGARLVLSGDAGSVTRFSADFCNSYGDFVLAWNPGTNATLDVVNRTYDRASSSLSVESGTVRFAEGAGVKKLAGIHVATGGTFVVAADAGDVSGASMALDLGGTLVVGKTHRPGANLAWNGTVRLERGTFPSSSDVQRHPSVGAAADLLFAGTDAKSYYVHGDKSMTLRDYAETPEAEMTGRILAYTSGKPVLTLKGTRDTRFSADVDNTASGSYRVRWQPVSDRTMSVVKRVYDNVQAGFQVGSGTLRVAEGAAFRTTCGVSVEAGARLAVAADAGTDWSSTDLTLAADATVDFEADVAVRVRSVTVGDKSFANGIFSSANAAWVTGPGAVVVGAGVPDEPETVARSWTGGGASAAIEDPANWDGTLPDLTDGSLVATFPAGAAASLPAAGGVWLKGLVAQGNLVLSGGRLTLGSAGLATAGEGLAVTVACPVAVYAPQTWAVGAGDSLVFTEKGVIGSAWPRCVGRIGALSWTGADKAARIELNASSPDLWNVDSGVRVAARADTALGAAGAKFRAVTPERTVELYGNAFENDFADAAETTTTAATLFDVKAGANVIRGKVTGEGSNAQYWHFDNSSQGTAALTFCGGYAYGGNNNGSHFSPIHNGTVSFAEVPFDVTRIWFGYRGYYSNVVSLNVASNVTTRGIVLMGASVLNTTVRDALFATDDGSSGVVMNGETTWNLSADQGVNVLSVQDSPRIASANGSTLTLRDDRLNAVKPSEPLLDDGYRVSLRTAVVQTNAAVFAGNVNFVKAGALDLWLDGESTTTGSLTVRAGRVVFRNGTWREAQAVTVDGGSVRFEKRAIGRKTALVVNGERTAGAIEIPSGVTVRCKSLTVNGKPSGDGTVTEGVVTGGGRLCVGRTGAWVVVR